MKKGIYICHKFTQFMDKFDLIVLGGGPAGYAAAMRGIDFGKKVCLIERNRIGGAGVYNGALSSKTLWELSSRVANVNETIMKFPGKMLKKRLMKLFLKENFNILVI